jgi:hypothetical protein
VHVPVALDARRELPFAARDHVEVAVQEQAPGAVRPQPADDDRAAVVGAWADAGRGVELDAGGERDALDRKAESELLIALAPHLGSGGAAAVEDAVQVDAHDEVPVVSRDVRERLPACDPGVRDEGVQTPEALDSLGDEPFVLLGAVAAAMIEIFVPMSTFLQLSGAARTIVSCCVIFIPIFFAGVIFAASFRDSKQPDIDIGANIAGVTAFEKLSRRSPSR